MARSTPTVRDEMLHDGAMAVPLASAGWSAWLAGHGVFRFEDGAGSFTARRERRAGGEYWYAYRRRAGRLWSAYLGRDGDLTVARLRLVARRLAATGAQPEPPDPALGGRVAAPIVAGESVARDRLLARLAAGLAAPLTIVAAPAGYGKTTLLAQWAARLCAGDAPPVAWLTLDPGDDDPVRFARHLAAALAPIGRRAGGAAGRDADIARLLARAAGAGPLVIILDDFQAIGEGAIHAALAELLAAPPAGLHLIIGSRVAPPLPLARLRAEDRLIEIGERELRFTRDETAALLARRHGVVLEPAALDMLAARTEGWAAALQLAGRSLRGRDEAGRRGFIAAFDGADRLIDDYLIAEVLDRLPERQRRFLLATAVAERLCAELAGALTGLDTAAAGALLGDLARAILLVQPLDGRGEWYRYHPLLADALRARLRCGEPPEAERLHRLAARWCAGRGLLPEAARHLVAARAHDELAELIVGQAEGLMARGEIGTLRAWLAAVPSRLLRDHPELTLWHAWTLSLGDDPDAVEPWLLTLEARLDDLAARARDGLPVPIYFLRCNRDALLGQADAMRVGVARRRGHPAEAVAFAERALRRLPPDVVIAGVIAYQLGLLHFRSGDLVAADTALAAARTNAERGDHALLLVGVLRGLAHVRLARGDRADAHALMRRARQVAQLAGGEYLGDLAAADPFAGGDPAADLALLEPLRPREREILQLLAEGLPDRAIAARLHLAPNTIRWHAGHLYGKLGATNRTQAVAHARRLGLLPA